MESDIINIRKAKREDIDIIANLIYCTEKDPGDIWGGETKKDCLENLKLLISTKESRYSLSKISVAEYNNKVLGAIVLIPYNELNKLSIKTDLKIISKFKGIRHKMFFIIDTVKYMILKECKRGDLYVANVATSKEARGLGIGKELMKYAEKTAKEEEMDGISLIAKDENVIKFYEKLNYIKIFDDIFLGERVIKMEKAI